MLVSGLRYIPTYIRAVHTYIVGTDIRDAKPDSEEFRETGIWVPHIALWGPSRLSRSKLRRGLLGLSMAGVVQVGLHVVPVLLNGNFREFRDRVFSSFYYLF